MINKGAVYSNKLYFYANLSYQDLSATTILIVMGQNKIEEIKDESNSFVLRSFIIIL